MRLTHTICSLEQEVEDDAYEKSLHAAAFDPQNPYYHVTYHRRHWSCQPRLILHKIHIRNISSNEAPEPPRASVDLRLLRTCRQINKEAALIPLSCNTFAISGSREFEFFLSKLLCGQQRRALSRLHFDDIAPYRTLLKSSTVATMTGLKHLQVFLSTGERPKDMKVDESLTKFIQLRVADVNVIVYERVLSPRRFPDLRAAREEAAGWEELLRTGETEHEFKW